ncbi:MAG: anhydro-N-acetylmuramic acid kinase, partial [Candidatus Eremiobacteraeota bacterium]|nr:anhydro-N-acetylmuramic acid kinase [Candidatus Eremiobacteraeota bacterium]
LEREFAGKANPPVLVTSDAYAMPPDAKEAMAFAVLAVAALHGQPANLLHATGAHNTAILGKLVPGSNFSTLMSSVWGKGP